MNFPTAKEIRDANDRFLDVMEMVAAETENTPKLKLAEMIYVKNWRARNLKKGPGSV